MTAISQPHVVYVSIGSNIEREENITACLTALVAAFGRVAASPVYESAAVGHSGHPYYNLVARFESDLHLAELVERLRGIETDQGRTRGEEKFSDRTLDIDVLLYDHFAGEAAGASVPRGEIFRYGHVALPLAELAPDLALPGDGRTAGEVWREMARSAPPLRRVRFEWRGNPLPGQLAE